MLLLAATRRAIKADPATADAPKAEVVGVVPAGVRTTRRISPAVQVSKPAAVRASGLHTAPAIARAGPLPKAARGAVVLLAAKTTGRAGGRAERPNPTPARQLPLTPSFAARLPRQIPLARVGVPRAARPGAAIPRPLRAVALAAHFKKGTDYFCVSTTGATTDLTHKK